MAPDEQNTKSEAAERKANDEARADAGVAKTADNAKLEHSSGDGGPTTRDDATDLGAPMLQGDASEPQGPEDALGRGPKRGDYTDRIGDSNYQPHQSVPVEGGGEPVLGDDGEVVDYAPVARLEPQRPRAEDRGDAEGLKGGVDTDPIAQGT